MAACPTVPQAAPPPYPTSAKKVISPSPRFRATSTSRPASMLNMQSPSTSDGTSPASSIAAEIAWQARESSLSASPLFDNCVWPRPTIAVLSRIDPPNWLSRPSQLCKERLRGCRRPDSALSLPRLSLDLAQAQRLDVAQPSIAIVSGLEDRRAAHASITLDVAGNPVPPHEDGDLSPVARFLAECEN